jgi:NhaA family Na+:H+ antiporter
MAEPSELRPAATGSGRAARGAPAARRLQRPDRDRDHIRGSGAGRDTIEVVIYGDYLCPYCRRLRLVLARLRETLGERLVYAYRQFPNEAAHPGAELASMAAEAAGQQGKFWQMHDALYAHDRQIGEKEVLEIARGVGLNMRRFRAGLRDERLRRRIQDDIAAGRAAHVAGTPTIFVDGVRYDGAWDFHSMLEALDRPVGQKLQRTARAFANLPASAGLVLLAAAAAALLAANSAFAPFYHELTGAEIGLGPPHGGIWMSVAEWCSEGLLAVFFLIVGLEIRREMTSGSLSKPRAAAAPILAAIGSVLLPAAIYLAINRGPTAVGWAAPADTGFAFTLAVLALAGTRAPAGLKAFVAAYAVVDDILSILILAVFYPHALHPAWLVGAVLAIAAMFVLNRWRIYAGWPYAVAAFGLWLMLHLAGVSGALAGVALAAFLPTRPSPSAAPLLAQAATALAELERTERELKRQSEDRRRLEHEPVWDWAARNLSAAADRLLSPAERIERQLGPWSTYLVLPLFAFTAAGVTLSADLTSPEAMRIFWGVALGLAIGKPLGIVGATWAGERLKLAVGPEDVAPAAFIGAACLCGIGDPLSILMAEQAFGGGEGAAAAKLGVLGGSALAVALGVAALALSPGPMTKAKKVG